ncbi:MAG: hypothetical protein UR62_C0003G0005 [Candidatus Nomurabacteria bacterium GW2011_GWF2_35_12]|uniref:VTT domain-containing protein n=3 Tax=Candidatus Nomuraibacteriota TaxID=1752729 RepID=A0A0G0DXF2_9BACT|nr:MAG: hypothetical protein UR62_C0003G0005 [Candidatus Nomurabacteria bacterium GW2011_GWF2_35_12]KKP71784.1 MAG: hypothetical protein UR70_C0019G0004 [Candidatus Nomurabacteria bacterium GW2011_GWB1_35_20]KKP76713.1 MAG: DedA [Parcubacteria group bacterium GW2011_GWC1_35_21]KKP78398.1 MAG: hypothetical protein UR77_C0003G0005 [Candidatus Nomurabacteria bacterium GW2011_GWC2_35_35]KKP88418.1 MAG: hypothetical protein UR92_C0005G0005 [Candidatus Nomurabacteria bacterium GW2011_GWA2_35_80]KKP9
MLALTFTDLVSWIIAHGYFIFFFTALVEGPLVTTAAGVAAALGYYNIIIIVLIAIAGDLTADVIYYFIGYHSRILVIEHYGHRFGITRERIEKIEKMIHTNFRKTMLVIKLSPIIPIPGLIAIGASRVPLQKFIEISLLITMPRSLLFAFLGFYSGKAYAYLGNTITNGSYIMGGLILVIVVIYLIYQKITSNIAREANIE